MARRNTCRVGCAEPGQVDAGSVPSACGLARADLAQTKRQGEFAISTTAGKKPISVRTLAGWANLAIGDSIDGFQVKPAKSAGTFNLTA